jgi:hypothetical protein
MHEADPRPDLWADFLAKYQYYQHLVAKKADLNCQKRTWAKKRQLRRNTEKRPRGAPPGNANALKHGFDTREQHAVWAMFRAFFRATGAAKRANPRPRSASAPGV